MSIRVYGLCLCVVGGANVIIKHVSHTIRLPFVAFV